jgi:hypothetical protein
MGITNVIYNSCAITGYYFVDNAWNQAEFPSAEVLAVLVKGIGPHHDLIEHSVVLAMI